MCQKLMYCKIGTKKDKPFLRKDFCGPSAWAVFENEMHARSLHEKDINQNVPTRLLKV